MSACAGGKKGRNTGLLGRPETVVQILEHLSTHLKIRVSIKMPLGMAAREEVVRQIPWINSFLISRVTIHARIGKPMYAGEPNLEGFRLAASLCKKRIVHNGDVKDLPAFRTLSSVFPGNHDWMIGRWTVTTPFLSEQIKADNSITEKRIRFKEFHDSLFEGHRDLLFGNSHLLDKTKELCRYFGLMHPERKRVKADSESLNIDRLQQCSKKSLRMKTRRDPSCKTLWHFQKQEGLQDPHTT
jgi:tRNA-dihydrouridine synthase